MRSSTTTKIQRQASRQNGQAGGRPRKFAFQGDRAAAVHSTAHYLRPLSNALGEQVIYDRVFTMLVKDFKPSTAYGLNIIGEIARVRSQIFRYDLLLDGYDIGDSQINWDDITREGQIQSALETIRAGGTLIGVYPRLVQSVITRITERAAKLRRQGRDCARQIQEGRRKTPLTADRQRLVDLVWPIDQLVELTSNTTVLDLLSQAAGEYSEDSAIVNVVDSLLQDSSGVGGTSSSARLAGRHTVSMAVSALRNRLDEVVVIQKLRNDAMRLVERLERKLIQTKKMGG